MKRIALALFSVLITGAAYAAGPAPSRLSYETSYMPSDGDAGDGMEFVSASAIHLEGKFSVWYLLGEPVINCAARWTNNDRASMAIDPLGDGARLIEPAQAGEIEIYNLLLAASGPDPRDASYGFGSAKTIAVLCDAGVVAQNGRDGFNVADSPSWDKFLCALPDTAVRFRGPDSSNTDTCLAMNGKWLNAAEAKEVALGGLKLSEVTALKARLNGVATMKRAEKRAWRERSAAFKLERAQTYFATFPAREGEGTAGWSARKNAAIRRLPKLPNESPSAEELQAYEDVWQAIVANNPPRKALVETWRENENALVADQLARLKALDKSAAREADRFFGYVTKVSRKKESEPVEPDPMAAYRTATLIIENDSHKSDCRLKKPDGTVVATGFAARDDICMRQPNSQYGIYVVRRTYINGQRQTVVFDNDGGVLLSTDTDHVFEFAGLPYGLVGYFDFSGANPIDYTLYSIIRRETIFRGDRAYRSSRLLLRKNRPALQFLKYANCYYNGSLQGRQYDYFYLDTERLEERNVCTPDDLDAMNDKHP